MNIQNKKQEVFDLSNSKQFFLGKKTNKILYTDETIYNNLKNKDLYDELNKNSVLFSIPNLKKFDRFGNVEEIDLGNDNDVIQPQLTFDQYGQGVLAGREEMESQQILKVVDVQSVDEESGMMFFSFFIENTIKWNGLKLKLGIKNDNKHNFIQLDTCSDNLIKSLSIFVNDELVEIIEDYGEIETLTNIIFESKSNYTNDNPLLNKNIEETLTSSETGSNVVFNPTIQYKDITSRMNIKDGKIQLNDSSMILFEVILKAKAFGNKNFFQRNTNLNNELVGKKITLGVLLNNRAFFVPVFNSKLNDIMNIYIDGSLYDLSRQLRKTKEAINDIRGEFTGQVRIIKSQFTQLDDNITKTFNEDDFKKIGNYSNALINFGNENQINNLIIESYNIDKPIILKVGDAYWIQSPSLIPFFVENGINIEHFRPNNYSNSYQIKTSQLKINKDAILSFNDKGIDYKTEDNQFYQNWPLKIDDKSVFKIKYNEEYIIREEIVAVKSEMFKLLYGKYNSNKRVLSMLFRIKKDMFKFNFEEIVSSSIFKKFGEDKDGTFLLFFLDYEYLASIEFDIFSVYYDTTLFKNILNYEEYKLKFIMNSFGDGIDILLDKNIDRLVSIGKIINFRDTEIKIDDAKKNEISLESNAAENLGVYVFKNVKFEKEKPSNLRTGIFSTLERNNITLETLIKLFVVPICSTEGQIMKSNADVIKAILQKYKDKEPSMIKKLYTNIKNVGKMTLNTLIWGLVKLGDFLGEGGQAQSTDNIYLKLEQSKDPTKIRAGDSILKVLYDYINFTIEGLGYWKLAPYLDEKLGLYDCSFDDYVKHTEAVLFNVYASTENHKGIEMIIEKQMEIIWYTFDILISEARREKADFILNVLTSLKKMFISVIVDCDSPKEIDIVIRFLMEIFYTLKSLPVLGTNINNAAYDEFKYRVNKIILLFTKEQDRYFDRKSLIEEYINNIYNPEYLTILEKKITAQINSNVMIEANKWTSQSEFYISNQKDKKIDTKYIGRKYNVINPQLHVEMFSNGYVGSPILPIDGIKKIFCALFEPMIGNTILLDENARRGKLLMTWTSFELYDVPTFRISTMPNIPFEDFTLEVNSTYKFVINGKCDDSTDNYEYLLYLANALGIESPLDLEKNTTINRFNYSICDSSSSYISKKLIGNETQPFFTFNDNIETFVKLIFDRDREMMSRFIIGIDLKTIMQKLNISEIQTIRISYSNTKRIHDIKEKYLINVYSI